MKTSIIDCSEYDSYLSKVMNSNFRVKVDDRLVGYFGLGFSIGFRRANHLIQKAMNSLCDKIVFKAVSPAARVIMYSK